MSNRVNRDINLFLQGKNGRENDGSILCLNYKNAFRSIHLHLFPFVMRCMGFPGSSLIGCSIYTINWELAL